MNHWLETSKLNLLKLSQSKDFKKALTEWQFTGTVIYYENEDDIRCELCEHSDLSNHFEIENRLNQNKLLVGSSCILKFNEINIIDIEGKNVIDPEQREFYLNESLQKKLVEIMLEPLRMLWRKDRTYIEIYATDLKNGDGISPNELWSLFKKMDAFNIHYNPKLYKISLRSQENKEELLAMSKQNLDKIKASLSLSQLKKFSSLFSKLSESETLMSYDEVIFTLKKNPGQSFISIFFSENDTFLSVYTIENRIDNPEWIIIGYEGGLFFSTDGEEDSFLIEDAPEEVKKLYFKSSKNFPDIFNRVSEYVLYILFPTLPDPETIYSKQEKRRFIKMAKECVKNTWERVK